MRQEQRGGMGSTNIQIIHNPGLTVEDVRAVAKGVFEENFAKLRDEAGATAAARAEEIREEFIQRWPPAQGAPIHSPNPKSRWPCSRRRRPSRSQATTN